MWQAFLFEWVLRFLVRPQFIVVDAAREFICKEFRNNLAAVEIKLLENANETYWSFGVCKRMIGASGSVRE